MHALREEFPAQEDAGRLEPRVAKIESDVAQLNSRLAGVEVDLRDFRKSMDQKLDKIDYRFANLDDWLKQLDSNWNARLETQDARWKATFEKQDAKWEARFEKQDARWEARFEKQDAKWEARFDKLDAKIDRLDAKFESRLEVMSTRRFTVWVTILASAATIGAAVLAIVFGSAHGH